MHKTTFAGLTELDPGDAISVDGASFTNQNPSRTDVFLRIGAVTHRHDGHLPLVDPTGSATLSVAASGGQIPADQQLYVAYTLVDAYGGETRRSDAAAISTSVGPNAPSGAIGAVFAASGSLPVGQFSYALTLNDPTGGESTLGPAVFITRPPGFASGEIQLSGLAQELSAQFPTWNLWRTQDGSDFQIMVAGGVSDTFTDSGLVCSDATRTPPDTMDNVQAANSLTMQLPTVLEDAAIGSAASMNLYISPDGSFTNPCFFENVPTSSAGASIVVTTLVLNEGAPPTVSLASQGANLIDPDTELLDYPWKRPVLMPSQLPVTGNASGDARLTLVPPELWMWNGTAWLAAAGGGGGSGVTVEDSLGHAMSDIQTLQFVGASGATVSVGSGFAGSVVITIAAGAGGSGSVGPTGPAGASGAPGATGPTGPAGASGAPGATGPAGASGATGATGAAGPTSFLASAGSSAAVVGPFLGFAASGVAQVSLTSSGGSAIVLITVPAVGGTVGPQGPTGPAGASGAPGATGPAGASGAPGATGPAGASGAPGPAGASGAPGATGPTGPTGPAGSGGTGGGGSILVIAASGGSGAVNPDSYMEFTGSGGINVAVQGLSGGSARVLAGIGFMPDRGEFGWLAASATSPAMTVYGEDDPAISGWVTAAPGVTAHSITGDYWSSGPALTGRIRNVVSFPASVTAAAPVVGLEQTSFTGLKMYAQFDTNSNPGFQDIQLFIGGTRVFFAGPSSPNPPLGGVYWLTLERDGGGLVTFCIYTVDPIVNTTAVPYFTTNWQLTGTDLTNYGPSVALQALGQDATTKMVPNTQAMQSFGVVATEKRGMKIKRYSPTTGSTVKGLVNDDFTTDLSSTVGFIASAGTASAVVAGTSGVVFQPTLAFAGSGGVVVGLAQSGGSAVVTITGPQRVIAASGGASASSPSNYTEFAGSGGVGVVVQALGGGSARILVGAGHGGTATLTAGTVTVSDPSITATMRIMLTAQDNNSTGALRVSARSNGISFTITSSNAGDTGVVAYEIWGS